MNFNFFRIFLYKKKVRHFFLGLIFIATAYLFALFEHFFTPFPSPKTTELTLEDIANTPSELLDELSDPFTKKPLASATTHQEETFVISDGDTLIMLLTQIGIPMAQAHEVIHSLSTVFNPRDLKIGQEVSVRYRISSPHTPEVYDLMELALRPEIDYEVHVKRKEDGTFSAVKHRKKLTRRYVALEGKITVSLYQDALKEGADPQILHEMIRAFSYDVDFQRDFHPGDHFSLFYDETLDEKTGLTRSENFIFGSLTLSGKVYKIYRFNHPKGGIEFYTDQGLSIRKELLKTPVDGARLSSPFGRRRHPVLGYTKMHKGVDFAAPKGTPVMAAGDGVVEKAAFYGSYGNYVLIRHQASGYKTAYAHLSRYAAGLRAGQTVRQGQVIAYIGTTGRSTGPHLHFELIKNGVAINPNKIKQLSGGALNGKDLKIFQNFVAQANKDYEKALLER